MSGDRWILSVGSTYVDIVNIVETYPEEDTDQRCVDYYWQRGGNASNSATCISKLGLSVEYMGVLADDREASWLREDYEKCGIPLDHCVTSRTGGCPVTSVVMSLKTGSRTITHTQRGLPELDFEAFDNVDLKANKYKWIHFEARPNVENIEKMFQKIEAHNTTVGEDYRIKTSLEIEQAPDTNLERLVCRPDFVFFSKDWARARGLANMADTVDYYSQKVKPGGTAICGWGDKGAAAKQSGSDVATSPAYPPERIIDTLGCGDTFVGSVVGALYRGRSVKESLVFGCRVAGAKCGMRGQSMIHTFRDML